MTYTSVNPYDEQQLASFENHTTDQLERIITQADTTYRGDWSRRPYAERSSVLTRAAALIRERAEPLAERATVEMGTLLREARDEVFLSADILDYYADHAAAFLADRPISSEHGEATVQSLL